MEKYKQIEQINFSDESIKKVVKDIYKFGFGKLEKVLSHKICDILVDAA